MRKKQGYTKRVLQQQIRKYEKALKMNDENFDDWLRRFGCWPSCPVCSYRHKFVSYNESACKINGFELCLAIVNNVRCESQYWFNVVNDGGMFNFPKIRRNLARRLKYWQRVYAEKYPEKL